MMDTDRTRWDRLFAVATAFLALFAIVGFALYGLPRFYPFFVQELGWTRQQVTSGNAYSKIAVALNGEAVSEMDLDRWTEAGKNPDGTANKFRYAYKEMARRGYIGLQDHGNVVWYRNIRIRELPKK